MTQHACVCGVVWCGGWPVLVCNNHVCMVWHGTSQQSAVQPNFQGYVRCDLFFFFFLFPFSHSYRFGHQQYQQILRSPRRQRQTTHAG
ncbi:uncharacterized protein LY79DRAFT_560804 [Colletotrichum navitas]|uniref:Uncharacterized protein n=1 Tax=Colletotrichum navitas TaxID=681940 RepID=A0AAD8V2F3_9PEZI|nr:uncharacterized protein LY79DRAFT_560804 [Colletotrichum navitas]KAK1580747.1 hypothetical protein LY79DRAFT_560804 [Colletotrichum navitas]